MGEVGPHRAGEDVWKEQKGERIYAMQKKNPRRHRMRKYRDGVELNWGSTSLTNSGSHRDYAHTRPPRHT